MNSRGFAVVVVTRGTADVDPPDCVVPFDRIGDWVAPVSVR